MLDYGAPSATTQDRQLEPRYRRILGFGDVLDESIGLFRRHWLTFAQVSAVWLIPPGLAAVLISNTGALNATTFVQPGTTLSPQALASMTTFFEATLAISLVWALFFIGWTASVMIVTDDYIHSTRPRLGGVLLRTLRRYLPTFASGLVFFVALMLLAAAAVLIFVVFVLLPPVGVLATLGSIVGAVLWWLRPSLRTSWLKWLIIVTAPFGLPAYFAGLWSMYVPAAVLENHGPLGALRRSGQLVNNHWFRTVTILTLAGFIVAVLQYIPAVLIQLPLTISAYARGQVGLGPTETAISTAATVAFQILFASMGSIVYAMVFIDLRNRREGTDLAERLSRLETSEALAAQHA